MTIVLVAHRLRCTNIHHRMSPRQPTTRHRPATAATPGSPFVWRQTAERDGAAGRGTDRQTDGGGGSSTLQFRRTVSPARHPSAAGTGPSRTPTLVTDNSHGLQSLPGLPVSGLNNGSDRLDSAAAVAAVAGREGGGGGGGSGRTIGTLGGHSSTSTRNGSM